MPNISLENILGSMQETRLVGRFNLKDSGFTKDTKKNYHNQRLGQSKWAFWLSFCGSIAGFLVIVWSIGYGVVKGDAQWPGIVSGIMTEVISVLFYDMSNKANEKISEFFEALTEDENIEKAIKLADEIEDVGIRDELKVKLSLHLAGIDEERICKNTKIVCEKQDT